MCLVLDTPILAHEVQEVFNITPSIYEWAVDRGVLVRRCFESDELAEIMHLHHLSDVISMAVMLSLGWPVRPLDRINDQAGSITCDLWQAWEHAIARSRSLDDQAGLGTNMSADDVHRSFHEARVFLETAILMRCDLSSDRKRCLAKYIRGLAALVREITLSSVAINRTDADNRTAP